jgi:hypothetical protein
VGGRPPPVQQPGRGQHKRADADGGDPGAATRGRPQPGKHFPRYGRSRVGEPRQDDRVGGVERVQPPRRPQHEGAGVDLRGHGADAHVVGGLAAGQPGPGEDLQGRRKVEGDDAIEREHGHGVHGREA